MLLYIWYSALLGISTSYSFLNIPPVADQFVALFVTGYAGLLFFISGLMWSHALIRIPAGLILDRFVPGRAVKRLDANTEGVSASAQSR